MKGHIHISMCNNYLHWAFIPQLVFLTAVGKMSLKAVSNVINKCFLHINKQCQKSQEHLYVLQCFFWSTPAYQMTWMSLVANPRLFSVYKSIIVKKVFELLFSPKSSTSCTSSEIKKKINLLLFDFLVTENWFMSKDKKVVDRAD